MKYAFGEPATGRYQPMFVQSSLTPFGHQHGNKTGARLFLLHPTDVYITYTIYDELSLFQHKAKLKHIPKNVFDLIY